VNEVTTPKFPLHVVSGLLGHASVKMTADIYGARAERNTDVAGRYIAWLSGATTHGAQAPVAPPVTPALPQLPTLPRLPTLDMPALVPEMVTS
jgi:hypothetical protein